ncbi:fimbrial biogenesis outer membrane usher protein [Burkholderia anthina]|uniref:fimbria/pilus outer membrane usher protein n=1 Tax=Burkholderia anthina TaxID=179879 RepID=UPI001CF51FEF|nr:fimbria/pilus outer membrane usher protein [Burkholderia anthina]MCA8093638.1 fimbrial biogenesis outer membrane usher protein [Burkholderia anthina]
MTKTVKPDPRYGGPRLRPLYAAVLSALAACHAAASEVESGSAPLTIAQVEFDEGFFPSGSSVTNDLSRFEKGNSVLPGTYNVDIYVNDNWIGRADVPFKASEATRSGDARACFDKLLLTRVGIDLAKLAPETAEALAAPGACLPLERIVDGATIALDFGEQRLDLGIQQASLSRNPRGYVSREFWSDGVNAGFLGYDANVYAYNNRGAGTQTQGYLGLNAGVNLGAWHFRHNGSYSWSSQGNAQYQSLNTYLQRDVPALLSQLIAGESYTTGELFDSVGFRGVRLSTDDRMLPDSLRGYAPTVRGIANSNAKVTIKQNGAIIYDTTVAPGAFEINDLYATGYGGDLTVEVTESDGSVHSFKVPYASVPLSLRPGISRYSITAGTLRDTMTSGNPWFTQGTWQRGFTNAVTGYVGATIAQGYGSAMVGGVLTTGIGAIGVDYTQAITTVPGAGRMTGGSARISYSKNVPQTGSNISIAAYRYSTGGFFDLGAAMQARDAADRGTTGIESVVRPRNRAQITFGQQLGERGGNLSLTASTVNYWNRGGSDINYSVGYSNTFRNVSLSLQATRQQSALGQQSTLYYASVTIPLGRQYPMTMSSSVSHDTNGRTQVRSMLSGSLGVDRNLSYGVNLNHSSGDGSSDTSGSANMLYRGRLADVSASAGSGSGNSQGSFGVRGAVVAHPGGVTLSQPLSETIGVIEAKGAGGARVLNASGVKLDSRGYAVVPYLTPYSMNLVEIDPKGLSTDVELKTTSQQVAPRAGSVVMLKYETETGRSAVIHALRPNGEPLPFGSSVVDAAGNPVGAVGQASKIFVRGLQDSGELTVKWGDTPDTLCHIAYQLPIRDAGSKADGYQRIDTQCVAPEAGEPSVRATPIAQRMDKGTSAR